MKNTIGEIVSRVRKQIKALNKDAFVTDRFIYSLLLKHGAWLIRREDSGFKLGMNASLFQTLEYVELVEVNKIEAGCTGLKSDCTIMRTKYKLPEFAEGYHGPIIRAVTSIDASEDLQPTSPADFIRVSGSKNFKYNKTKYYWYLNGYMYFPNLDWDAVRIEGIFTEDISGYTCDDTMACAPMQDQLFPYPAYLHGELESHVLKDDLLVMYQIPSDPTFDKQSPAR